MEANPKTRCPAFTSLRAVGEAIQKSNNQIESIGSLPLIVGY